MSDIKAIVGGQVIDGSGAAPIPDGVVLIDGERISHVGDARSVSVPEGAQRIDATGASVLPGLMDVHVHISLNAPADLVRELLSRPLGQVAFEVANNLRLTIAGGVTSIRTVSDLAHLDIAARDSIAKGVMTGPRIHPCGKGLTTTGGHGELMPCWLCQSHGDIAEVRAGCRSIEHGMDFDEDCAEAARAHSAFLVPTLTVMNRILVHGAEAGVPEYMIDNVRRRTVQHHRYVKHAFDGRRPTGRLRRFARFETVRGHDLGSNACKPSAASPRGLRGLSDPSARPRCEPERPRGRGPRRPPR